VLSLPNVKTIVLILPLAALVVAEGVVSFLGCGSTTTASNDGGLCEPSCPDALLDSPTDVSHDVQESDGAINCNTACQNQTHAPGCPYPGCVMQCERIGMACLISTFTGPFNDLVACESTAHFTCESTPSGTLPVAAACSDAAAAVAAKCYPDAGDAGMDAMVCMTAGSQSACAACCMGSYIEGYDTYNVALESCACESPGTCASQCGNSLCTGTSPEAGDPCSKCLTKATAPDGGCNETVTSACAMDPVCTAYEACLATCPLK
jgi:hypothetical protein